LVVISVKAGIKFNNAVSTYIKRLAEGISCNGETVRVLMYTHDYSWQETVINNVTYINSLKGRLRSRFRFIRGLTYYWQIYIATWCFILSLKKEYLHPICVHIGDSDVIRLNLVLACRILGVDYFANILEHPFRAGKGARKAFISKVTSLLSPGTIYISHGLKNELGHQHGLVVPPTVEAERLLRIPGQQADSRKFTIGYCGTISNYKDGFDILVGALQLVRDDLKSQIKLLIIGDSNRKDQTIKSFEQELSGLQPEIELQFTGRLENDEVMKHLQGCQLLVLTRPENFQTRYGFPSKLPEYLSTGRPVLVTRVSDIPLYLENGISAYLLDAASPVSVARTIEHIIQNYAEACEVGERGFEVAQKVFNNQVQGKRVLEFCRNPQGAL